VGRTETLAGGADMIHVILRAPYGVTLMAVMVDWLVRLSSRRGAPS
jgi:hypothetical protein